jgi:hypothetical protein
MTISDRDTRVVGRIRAIAAPRVLIGVGDTYAYRKVLLLVFSSDGSVFVQWPYFCRSEGLLASLAFPGGRAEGTHDLGKTGRITSHHVKYAHHTDGEVHFSQDGRILTRIRRTSFRLDGPTGQLFQFGAYDLTGFTEHLLDESSQKRPEVLWTYPSGVPAALSIVGKWYRRDRLQELVLPEIEEIGPHAALFDDETDSEQDVVFVGQLTEWESRSNLLMLSCKAVRLPKGIHRPTIIFMAGGDAEDEMNPRTHQGSGALIAIYPYDRESEGLHLIDSLDLLS